MPEPPDIFDDMFRFTDDDPSRMPRDTRDTRYTRTPHPMPCPSIGVILRLADPADASITPRKRARIFEHVRCCETCQLHYERALDEVLHGGGVLQIYNDACQVNQAALRRRDSRFQHRLYAQIKLLTPPLGPRYSLGQWLPLAAILAVMVMAGLLFRPAIAVIHAEEVIQRAIAYERAHASESLRVRQSLDTETIAWRPAAPGIPRVESFYVIRDVNADGRFAAEMRPVSVREREAHAVLERLFEKHHFDWGKPFCVTCYDRWRASLARRRDSVTVTGDMLTLRTIAFDGGDLLEVTLTLDRHYRLVRQTLLFEGLGRIVIHELARQAAPANQRASATDARAVVDAGFGPLAPSVASRRPPAASDPGTGARRQHLPLSRWLERTFPPALSEARSAFLPEIERHSSSVRQHLVVLQRLANITSSAKLKNGTDVERARVRQQVELEYQSLLTHLRELEARLNLLLGSGSRARDFETPEDWQRRSSMALPHATRLEHRLRRLFTHEDLPPEETQASRPRSTRAAFEGLWDSIYGDSPN